MDHTNRRSSFCSKPRGGQACSPLMVINVAGKADSSRQNVGAEK